MILFNKHWANPADTWKEELDKYLKDPSTDMEFKVKKRAMNFVLVDGEMYKRSLNGVLLKCLNKNKALKVIGEIHEGICISHESGTVMRWLMHRHGYYWPTITADCFQYAKGCEAYQLYGPKQRVPAEELHPIIKPWPFRGWAMDLIGKIYPPSSK